LPASGLVEVLGLDDVEAAQVFLRLSEGAVGGQHLAVGDANDGGGVRPVQGAAEDPGAGRPHLLVEGRARAFLVRKRAEGKTPREARRALKRHLAVAVYRALVKGSEMPIRLTPPTGTHGSSHPRHLAA
jgi:hypothetical protein